MVYESAGVGCHHIQQETANTSCVIMFLVDVQSIKMVVFNLFQIALFSRYVVMSAIKEGAESFITINYCGFREG